MKTMVDYLFEETNRVVGIEDEVFKYLDDMSSVSNELVALVKQKQDLEIKTAEINTQIAEAKQYLADTGWYIERLNDPSSGKAIPEEVLAKRAEARESINTLEAGLEVLSDN